jgi:hypothetical protein
MCPDVRVREVDFFWEKLLVMEVRFYWGFLRFCGVRCGEVVVKCVVKAGSLNVIWEVLKLRHAFELYFQI